MADEKKQQKKRRVLIVVANPSVSTTVGGPVGFWGSELTHPYWEFMEAGYDIDLASPAGGEVKLDALSDPRDPSKYSANDLITMGFVNTEHLAALLKTTKKLDEVKVDDYDAIMVAGGQSPMFTFRNNKKLADTILAFYEKNKVTAALCHGTCALLDVKSADGKHLIAGKTMTGFANVEEDYADAWMKTKVMPFRIQDEATKLGANFVTAGLWKPFAIRDGNLITGQQQHSGTEVARLVIEALGK